MRRQQWLVIGVCVFIFYVRMLALWRLWNQSEVYSAAKSIQGLLKEKREGGLLELVEDMGQFEGMMAAAHPLDISRRAEEMVVVGPGYFPWRVMRELREEDRASRAVTQVKDRLVDVFSFLLNPFSSSSNALWTLWGAKAQRAVQRIRRLITEFYEEWAAALGIFYAEVSSIVSLFSELCQIAALLIFLFWSHFVRPPSHPPNLLEF